MTNALRIALSIALTLTVGTASAAIVTISGDDVKFTYDDSSLFGTGAVIGNTIFFTPETFNAESLNGAGLVQTSESLDITTEITSIGYAMDGFQVLENGDYFIKGIGASVSAVGGLTIDSQTSVDIPMNRLITAETRMAAEKKIRGRKWSARKPLKNLPNA